MSFQKRSVWPSRRATSAALSTKEPPWKVCSPSFVMSNANRGQLPIWIRSLPPFPKRAKRKNVCPSTADKRGFHEYINTYPEPASGHQILCARHIGSSELENSLSERSLVSDRIRRQ